jgi:hypothetical protein
MGDFTYEVSVRRDTDVASNPLRLVLLAYHSFAVLPRTNAG